MTLEKQVCNLDLAKRLKELGVKQEGHFSWYEVEHYQGEQESAFDAFVKLVEPTLDKLAGMHDICSAFTVAELGEMLKEHVNGIEYGFSHGSTDWHVYIEKIDDEIFANTEADARAKMLIHLLENKLIAL